TKRAWWWKVFCRDPDGVFWRPYSRPVCACQSSEGIRGSTVTPMAPCCLFHWLLHWHCGRIKGRNSGDRLKQHQGFSVMVGECKLMERAPPSGTNEDRSTGLEAVKLSPSTRLQPSLLHHQQPCRRLSSLLLNDDVGEDYETGVDRSVTLRTVYALDRTVTGLGVVGGIVGGVGAGGGPGVVGICGPPTGGSLTPTDYVAAACYPSGSTITLNSVTHPQLPGIVDPATMTPTSAPAPTVATGPNNSITMSQLGTVYATKRRRRNGKSYQSKRFTVAHISSDFTS
ncbi:hypothetical protein PV328_006767, partial [Microctonus aethiopoides]